MIIPQASRQNELRLGRISYNGPVWVHQLMAYIYVGRQRFESNNLVMAYLHHVLTVCNFLAFLLVLSPLPWHIQCEWIYPKILSGRH